MNNVLNFPIKDGHRLYNKSPEEFYKKIEKLQKEISKIVKKDFKLDNVEKLMNETATNSIPIIIMKDNFFIEIKVNLATEEEKAAFKFLMEIQ